MIISCYNYHRYYIFYIAIILVLKLVIFVSKGLVIVDSGGLS